MMYRIATDLLVILHLGFIVFVVAGGVLCIKWRKLIWIHIPAIIWGTVIELSGWICPLTPLENYFRRKSGEAAYAGDFVSQYLVPVIYPESLTREIQWLLALAVLVINGAVYTIIVKKHRR